MTETKRLRGMMALSLVGLMMTASVGAWAEPEMVAPAMAPQNEAPLEGEIQKVVPGAMPLAAPSPAESMVVPVETVLYIKLRDALSSETNQVGDQVYATIDEPLNLGPYTAIPTGSELVGQVTHVNGQVNNDGYNPYVVVHFGQLKRPEDKEFIAFDGTLIAYKSGLRKSDYVWRLPKPGDRKRSHIKNVVGGAVSGALFNPIIGPPIGMAAGLLKSVFSNRISHGGQVEINPEKVLPISVKRPFLLPMSETAMNPVIPGMPADPTVTGEIPVAAPVTPSTPMETQALPESKLHEDVQVTMPQVPAPAVERLNAPEPALEQVAPPQKPEKKAKSKVPPVEAITMPKSTSSLEDEFKMPLNRTPVTPMSSPESKLYEVIPDEQLITR